MVEIELVTTKKRLTASVLNQMFTPTLEEMRYIKCLGIVNIKSSKLLLVTKSNEYRILSIGWKKYGRGKIYRKGAKGSLVKIFESEEKAEEFLTIYNEIVKSNPKQIFI